MHNLGGSENPTCFASHLKLVEEASGDADPPVGCLNVDKRHKATFKKSVIHYAVAEKNSVLYRHETFTAIDCALYERPPGFGRRIDSLNLLDLATDGRSNRDHSHNVLRTERACLA